MRNFLLVAPHDDDVELFAAFTAIEYCPRVVICSDGHIQGIRGLPVTAAQRAAESVAGLGMLGIVPERIIRLGIPDTASPLEFRLRVAGELEKLLRDLSPGRVFCPALHPQGHAQHNAVTEACAFAFSPNTITRYLTYTTEGKQTCGPPVLPKDGAWISQKLRAMACHESQLNLDPRMGCWPHFMRGIEEFYES